MKQENGKEQETEDGLTTTTETSAAAPVDPGSIGAKPTIRVRDNLTTTTGLTKPSEPQVKLQHLEKTTEELEEDIKALRWLAKRKEREWDRVIDLIRNKECALDKAKRAKKLAQHETQSTLESLIATTNVANGRPKTVTKISVPGANGSTVTKAFVISSGNARSMQEMVQAAANAIRPNNGAGTAGEGPKIVSVRSAVVQPNNGGDNQGPKIVSVQSVPQSGVGGNPKIVSIQQSSASGSTQGPKIVSIQQSGASGNVQGPKIVSIQSGASGNTQGPKIVSIQSVQQSGVGGTTQSPKIVSVQSVQQSGVSGSNTQRPKTVQQSGETSKSTVSSSQSEATKLCEGCHKKPPMFLCSGCESRSYCSRDCQVADWEQHAEECEENDDKTPPTTKSTDRK